MNAFVEIFKRHGAALIFIIGLSASLIFSCARTTPPALVADSQTDEQIVKTGLDVIAAQNFERLKGRRVGLLTLPSSRTTDGRLILDAMIESGNVHIAALYAIDANTYETNSSPNNTIVEPRTRAYVYTLSSDAESRMDDLLGGIDLLVIDVPDSGTRFNPSLALISMMLEGCTRRGIDVLILDRPNPLGGLTADGPYPAARYLRTSQSFYPMPIIYGMTLGEIGKLYNDYFGLHGNIDVVEIEGWKRYWKFDRTGLPWAAPAPEIQNLKTNLLFVALCPLAAANVSVGMGTNLPWGIVGAPYIDGHALAAELNKRPAMGLAIQAVGFTPEAGENANWRFAGEVCQGVSFNVTDVDQFQPVRFSIQLLCALYKLYPDQIEIEAATPIIGRPDVIQMVKRGDAIEKIIASWSDDRLDFNNVRIEYLLY